MQFSLPVIIVSLLLLLALGRGEAAGRSVTLKRQVFYTDPLHRVSVTLSSENQAATMLHALLVFSPALPGVINASHYHNGLIISPKKFDRYVGISSHSEYASHRYFNVLAKGLSFAVQYDVAPYSALGAFISGTREYDALLLLDRHSSVWNEFDTLLFEQSRVTLSLHQPHHAHPQKQDFVGFYQLHCDAYTHDHCAMKLHDKRVNGQHLHHGRSGRLVVDLDAPYNLLPHDLYVRWKYHGEREWVISEGDGTTVLRLNGQFQYRLNHHSDDIVMGVDVIQYFQAMEVSLHRQSIVFWYSRIYDINDTYELHKSLIFWLLGLILTCISCWFSSPTYDVLHSVLKKRSLVDYPYQLVIVDLVVLVLAPILWILVFVAGDAWANAFTCYPHSVVLRRQLLVFSFGLYHFLLQIVLLSRSGNLIKQCFRHYYHYFRSFVTTSRVDQALVEREAEPVSVKLVLMRNLAGHTLAVTNFLLIVNYVSDEQLVYNIAVVIASLCLMFYYVKIIFSSAVYVSRNGGVVHEPLFTFLCTLSAALFIVYSVLGTYTHYTDFFMLLNSVFSELDVRTFAVEFQCFIATVALICVFAPLVRYVRKKQRRALKEEKANKEK